MPGEKSYKVNGEVFDIPDSEVSAFLKDNPGATEVVSYKVNKDTLDIPVTEINDFLKDTPGAEPLKKKAETVPSQSPLPLLSSSGASASEVTPLESSGMVNYMTGQNNPVVTQPLNIPEQNPQDLLRAAGTSQETIPVDQNNYDQEIQRTGLGEPMGEKEQALTKGMLRLGSGLMKTPGFLYDIASSVTNNVINRPFGLNDAPTAAEIGTNVPDELNIIKDVDQTIADMQAKQNKKYDKGISDYFAKGEYGKGFDLLSNSIIETAPTTIALMMGNAAGLSTAGSVAAGGAVFGAEKMSQLEKENPNMSQEQKLTVAAANGLLEGAFEQFGLTKIGGLTKDVLLKEGAEAAKKVAEEGFKSTYRKVLSRYLGTSAEEALSEAATQFSQNVIDKYSGVNPDLDLKSGVVDAAIIGLGAGSSMSAPTTLLQVVKTNSAIKQAAKLEEQRKALEEDIQSPDVTDEAKAAISEKIKDVNEEEATLAKEETDKFNELTPEGKSQVNELLDKSKKLADAAIDQSISDKTKEILKKDIDAIDKQIDEVYEMSKAEAVVPEGKPVDADIQDEIDYLNEIKNSGVPLTEEENARLTELVPVTETPASELGLVQGEVKSEPAKLSPEIENVDQSGEINTEQQASHDVAADVKVDEPVASVKKQTPSKELIDEDEQIDSSAKDDDKVVDKMNTDIEAMKQMKTEDLAEKKFVGMIERAWKAKEEGKITRPTYTAFRNKAKDILAGKVGAKDNVESTEAKLKVTAALNKVKEKLLGQDYKKITLSSIVPITPKNIADLIDLANAISHRAIDAGFTVAEAATKALSVIKKHPTYKKLVTSKEIDEKEFDKSFKESNEVKKKKPESDKKEDDVKKESSKNEVPDNIKKGKGQRRTSQRLNENKRFQEITNTITDEEYNMYDKIDQKKANQYIKDKISEYEKAGLIEELANKMLEDESPFPEELSLKAPLYLSDRLRVIAESEGNEFTKNALNKLAGKVNVMVVKNTTPAAQKIGLLSDINQTLPLSVEGLKEFANEKISQTQDQHLNPEQQAEIKEATQSLNDILDTEEIKKAVDKTVEAELVRISEETKGKEWTSKALEAIDSLKIDLTDC